jgi:hypothetical protein
VAYREGDSYGTKEGDINSDGSFRVRGLPPGQVRVHLPFDSKTSQYFSLLRVEYSKGARAEARAMTPKRKSQLLRILPPRLARS